MTWFKVDDGFHSHPKVLALSDAAVALWTKAGSWAAFNLTDGHVPAAVLPLLRSSKKAAHELVRASLWVPADDGWLFHDWHAYQPTRARVTQEREFWRKKKAAQRAMSPDMSPGDSPGESHLESP